MNLKVGTRVLGDVTIVDLDGEVDVYTAPQLKQQTIELLQQGVLHIVVNLTAVEYLDSTALGVLIGGLKRLRERGGTLGLICPNPRIRRIFEITGLDRIFDIFETDEQAVRQSSAKGDE